MTIFTRDLSGSIRDFDCFVPDTTSFTSLTDRQFRGKRGHRKSRNLGPGGRKGNDRCALRFLTVDATQADQKLV